jgi:hypothetical protein
MAVGKAHLAVVCALMCVVAATACFLFTRLFGLDGYDGVMQKLAAFQLGHLILYSITVCLVVWRVPRKQVLLLAPSTNVAFLGGVVTFIWDCRIYHQLLEMLVFVVSIEAITLMRKMIGRLEGLQGRRRCETANMTSFQKTMLGVAVPIFAIEMGVSSYGPEVQIAKTVCWGILLCNMWFHFGQYLWGLNKIFGVSNIGSVVKPSNPVSLAKTESIANMLANGRKARKAKSNLKWNIFLMALSTSGSVSILLGFPSTSEGYGCVPRVTEGGMRGRFVALLLFTCVVHANWLQTLFLFKKKKKREGSGACAASSSGVAASSYGNRSIAAASSSS